MNSLFKVHLLVGCGGARSLRKEPQHAHTSATIKTKMHVPLIGFSHSQSKVPFAITNVAVRKLSLRGAPQPTSSPTYVITIHHIAVGYLKIF
jgi:hypothetical protein